MEQSLNALPALAYVKYLHTWLVVNHDSEPISWTDNAVEVAWLAAWVSGKCSKDKSEIEICCGQHNQAAGSCFLSAAPASLLLSRT